jgi:hypothetical protein
MWIDQIDQWDERNRGFGLPLSPSTSALFFVYEGETLILTSTMREYRNMRISSTHVGGVPKYAWAFTPPLEVRPPFFVTDELATVVIFNGPVAHVDLVPRFNAILPWFGTCPIPVGGDGWVGVLTLRVTGLLSRKVRAHLTAYSTDPQTTIKDGEVFGPFDHIPMGTLRIS